MRASVWVFSLVSFSLIISGSGVDRNNFKTCQQSSFCRRCRAVEPGKSNYELLLNTLKVGQSSIEAVIVNKVNLVKFQFLLYSLVDGTFRVKINELEPLKPRYEVEHALAGEPNQEKLQVLDRTAEYITIQSGANKVTVHASPFRVDFFSGNQLVVSANARGLLRFEHLRVKPEPQPEGEEGAEVPQNIDDTVSDPGAWEENFKSHHDTKPNGPSAVAMDFSFVGAHHAYGIPEHADSFALKSTRNTDPYRLYNLDVFEYELGNGMALYGSVPVLVAHGMSNTAGVFWMNAAETWVDIQNSGDQNVVSSIVNFVSGSAVKPQVDAHFMSESGIIDVFIMLGPKPADVFRQYSKLTGTAPLPQMFAIAYHQCRWNYNDQDDVRNVDAGFDEYDIPMDVMWLDIEHTDSKKYFTWDPIKFSNPTEMTNNLTAKGRKMVTIVDPHIKRDPNYFLHNDAEANGYYIKHKDGKDYEGWCWPGSSSYLDFYDPRVRDYYRERYLLENYPGSTLDTYNWNDMNEPSVFNGPEVTLPKDVVHYGGWEHRDVHNTYGLLNTMVTFAGQLQRSNGKLRPFILTRSHYSGSQRYTAVWTGDNMAEWSHLAITIPMCLSLSVAGISFCGADVGGFFKSPNAELMTRWYQAGAYQPFMRAHSHLDTKRREPWLFDEDTTLLIREALRQRYALLPYWYTLFYEHERTGMPVMRPLWVEFPSESGAFAVDDEYCLGGALLVHPVTKEGATEVTVYFPGGPDQHWYHLDSYHSFTGGSVTLPVNIETVPVFQRGGTIIPRKERVRRSSVLMRDDPYTLIVALDKNGTASGTLYIDDEQSYNYRQGNYLYLSLKYEANTLSSKYIDNTMYPTKSWLERVIIVGLPVPPSFSAAQLKSNSLGEVSLTVSYDSGTQSLTIRKPAVSMSEEWSISLH